MSRWNEFLTFLFMETVKVSETVEIHSILIQLPLRGEFTATYIQLICNVTFMRTRSTMHELVKM